jgi:hypothetical protein
VNAVLLAVDRTRGVVRDEVVAACQRLGAPLVECTSNGERPKNTNAALVVAGLRTGERAIPKPVLSLLDDDDSTTPLLLGSDEPLVRPIVHLQRGRVIVAGSTASAARVRGLVRMLLAEALGGWETTDGTLLTTERLRPTSWSAEIASAVRIEHASGATTALVPLHGGDVDRDLVAATSALDVADDDLTLHRLGDAFGDDVGLVHLTADARTWLAWWPGYGNPLWLHSPVRLPHAVDLARRDDGRPRAIRLNAQPGDLIASLTAPFAAHRDLESLLADGGPTALERLRDRGMRGPCSGALTEVR